MNLAQYVIDLYHPGNLIFPQNPFATKFLTPQSATDYNGPISLKKLGLGKLG